MDLHIGQLMVIPLNFLSLLLHMMFVLEWFDQPVFWMLSFQLGAVSVVVGLADKINFCTVELMSFSLFKVFISDHDVSEITRSLISYFEQV